MKLKNSATPVDVNRATPSVRRAMFRAFRILRRLVGGKSGRGYASLPVVGALYRWVYRSVKPSGITRVPYHGIPVYVDADDLTHQPILVGSDYNDPEIALCRSHLKPGMVAIDLGANIGCFAVVMAEAVGATGTVYAFEPEPRNAGLLTRNLTENGLTHAHAVAKAVGAKPSTARLYLSQKASGYHHLYEDAEDTNSVEVDVVSLDSFFGGSPPEVDFLKMDVQGAEPDVLRGMTQTLAASPNLRLITELEPSSLEAAGEDPRAFLNELRTLGFRLHHISHDPSDVDPLPTVTVDEALRLCESEAKHINLFCTR